MGVLSVTESNFDQEVLQSSLPVLADFWAEWCGPCRMVAPIVEELATEMAGRLKVVKVNVDEAQQLAGKFGIMSIPTLLLFKQGKVVNQIVGAMSKDNLVSRINQNL